MKFYKPIFFSFASGERQSELGLKGRRDSLLSVSNYQYLLQNPFYYGLIRYNGEFFEGKQEPIIFLLKR